MAAPPPRSPLARSVLAVAAVLVAALFAIFTAYRATRPVTHAERFTHTRRAAGDVTPKLFQAPDFAYTSHRGQHVTRASLGGRPAIVDFIFTQCTSECPRLTANMSLVARSLAGVPVQFVSFSVDPEHDTPAVLAKYAASWNPLEDRWTLLATSRPALGATLAGFQVRAEPSDDPNNPIVHSSAFVLVDGDGWVRGVYASGEASERARLVADAKTLAGPVSTGSPTDPSPRLLVSLGCLGCHENPRVAPSLAGLIGSEVQLASGMRMVADEAYVRRSITAPAEQMVQGYAALMPSYERELRAADVDALVGEIAKLPVTAPRPSATAAVVLVEDPICHMQVRASPDTIHVSHAGREVYFCAESCRDTFVAQKKNEGAPPR